MFKVYFDTSGKAPQHSQVTFACCAAEEPAWDKFRQNWEKAFQGKSISHMHMKEAMGTRKRGLFAGWSEAQINSLMDGLLHALRILNSDGMKVLICSADLQSYKHWKVIHSHLPSLVASCASWCFWRSLKHYEQGECRIPGRIEAFFDRGDPFMKHVMKQWEGKRLHKQFPVLELVSTVGPVDMKAHPPVQAADMFAWCSNRVLAGCATDWQKRIAQLVMETGNLTSVQIDDRQFLHQLELAQRRSEERCAACI